MSSPLWKYAAAIAAMLTAMTGTAAAQICGDADDSGAVTVTDGVQALRAAAGLDSTCTSATCDIDGSGAVTVTDGVNVLRKAAGIVIAENCGSLDSQVESLLKTTLPIFGDLIKFGGAANAAGSTAQQCDNSDGSFEIDDETGEITFSNCELGGLLYNGTLGGSADSLILDLEITDLSTGATQEFSGEISGQVSGENFIVSGSFDFSSSFGDFSVELDALVTDPEGFFIGGALEFSVTDATLPEVDAIRLNFDPSDIALVEVILVDESTIPFNFNTVTGELTPVSN